MCKTNYIAIEGQANNWEEAIQLCGQALHQHGIVDDKFAQACIEREKEYPTGLPSNIPVAIPHSLTDGISESGICFLRLDKPVRFNRMDNCDEYIETNIIFNLAIKEASNHINVLQNLMKLIMNDELINKCQTLDINEISTFIKSELE